MSKAEERALEAIPYCEEDCESTKEMLEYDRTLFTQGYEQAVQDLMTDAIETTIDGKAVKVIVIDE